MQHRAIGWASSEKLELPIRCSEFKKSSRVRESGIVPPSPASKEASWNTYTLTGTHATSIDIVKVVVF